MLQFSDSTNKSGIIQQLERTLGFNDGDISGNTLLMAQFTNDVNQALTDALTIIFKAGGTWNFDDSNHTGYPILTANIVSGQQDYTFTADSASNLILDIFKVQVKTDSTEYKTINPADMQVTGTSKDKYQTSNAGTPVEYDKTANGIFLYPTPNANVTDGLQIFINREASYFTVSDTTKKPGIASLFHRYLVLHPADNYSMINNLANRPSIQQEKLRMEMQMADWYGRRSRDEKPSLKANVENTR